MKIAMIGHKRVPSREGGVEVVVTELSTRMVALGHQVDCYNRWEPSVQKHMKRVDAYEGVRLLRVRTFRSSSLNAIVYAFCAVVRACFSRYDVLHLHAEGPAAMTPLARLFGIPTVVTIHGLDWQRAKWGGFATRFLRFGERMAARYATELIVLGEPARQYFRDTYGKDSTVIPNGIRISPRVAASEITQKWGLTKDGYVLFLARIVPEKGLDYLLDAYLNIQTDKQLVVAGKLDGENAYIASICEKAKRDSRVVLTDFVQGAALAELFSNASVYVLPSDVEGLPISLLEALSYGTRCLVSDIPENRDTAGEHAHYFSHGDTQSLRRELQALLSAPYGDAEAQSSIAYVREHYDWDGITHETLAAYRHATDKQHKPLKQAKRFAKAE